MRLLTLSLLACGGPNPTEPESDTDTDADTDSDTDTDADTDTDDTDTDTDTDTDVVHTGPPPVVDCSVAPNAINYTVLDAPRAYHGLAFDQLGNMVGSDGTSLIRASSPTMASLWIPNRPGLQQMDYLPNGDLASTGGFTGNIVSVDPAGIGTVLASGISGYGLEVGPDGMIYSANEVVVHRVDPAGGGANVVVPAAQVGSPKVVNFSPDGTKMYVGTNSFGGVYEIDLDANYDPIFPARLLATTPGSWHDGLGVDACGNLYVAEYWTGGLYLITPAGDVSQLINYEAMGGGAYGHGIQWGSGVGPWSDHSIFVPLPYNNNRVAEIQVNLPSKDYNGGYYVTTP